ncbi:MAG TPA: DUF1501 domain-containing protein [Chthonomonadaceae bacterium]|nr:DUF1501 domain-containing protein [Chthonomonadaceae bacterium]
MSNIARRQVLTGAALAAVTGAAAAFGQSRSGLASIAVGDHIAQTGADTLVVLFLRGGADGLNIVAPYGDDHYYRLRPTLGLGGPNDRKTAPKSRLVKLDDFFGLHPALAPLGPLHDQGVLAAVHAIGSDDQSRSHFEAMEAMERGLAQVTGGTSSGWLARHLQSTAKDGDSPLRAVAFSETMPDSLRGATGATAMTSLADFRLVAPFEGPTGAGGAAHHAPAKLGGRLAALGDRFSDAAARRRARLHADPNAGERLSAFEQTLREMYGLDGAPAPRTAGAPADTLRSGGAAALAAMDAIKRLDPANYKPEPGAKYPDGDVGNAFRQVACLVKGDAGLEIACLEMGGWDTHVAQGADIGWQALRLTELGQALAAFAHDLGPHMGRVTTVVMTEFGRRAQENSGLGTDHGRAGAWLLMGGPVVGGKVHADWPGLGSHQLDPVGDLRVTTDYRDVLAEIVRYRLKNDRIADVFPDYTPRYRGVVSRG